MYHNIVTSNDLVTIMDKAEGKEKKSSAGRVKMLRERREASGLKQVAIYLSPDAVARLEAERKNDKNLSECINRLILSGASWQQHITDGWNELLSVLCDVARVAGKDDGWGRLELLVTIHLAESIRDRFKGDNHKWYPRFFSVAQCHFMLQQDNNSVALKLDQVKPGVMGKNGVFFPVASDDVQQQIYLIQRSGLRGLVDAMGAAKLIEEIIKSVTTSYCLTDSQRENILRLADKLARNGGAS
jgi:hypothetical protein